MRTLLLILVLIILTAIAADFSLLETAPNINAADAVIDAGPPLTTAAVELSADQPAPRQTIRVPISVYIVDGDDNGALDSALASTDIEAIYEATNEIWAQAGIEIEITTLQRLEIPQELLLSVTHGRFRSFFARAGVDVVIPEISLLNGFYAQSIGGPNGIVPFSSNIFFVSDTPSNSSERVTAHEIGHILGLHHTWDGPDRLMYSGADGRQLTPDEITVARYVAQGLLDNLR